MPVWRARFSSAIPLWWPVSGIALLYHGKGGVTLSTVGVSLVILSSLLYAFYIIGVNQTHTKLSPVKFTFWIVFFGLIALLVYTLFIGERLMPLRTPLEWASALQLALLPTVLSLYFINIAIEHIGSTPTAIMGAVEPVTAVCIGVLIFGESFTLRLAIGIVLILSAVILLVLSREKKTEK